MVENGNVENLLKPVVVYGKLENLLFWVVVYGYVEKLLNPVDVLNFWAFAAKAEIQINANKKSFDIFYWLIYNVLNIRIIYYLKKISNKFLAAIFMAMN